MASKLIQQHLDRLLSEYHYLDFRGIMQLEKVVALELDEVFVPLRALPLDRPVDEKLESLCAMLEASQERAGKRAAGPQAVGTSGQRVEAGQEPAGMKPEVERQLELAEAGRRAGEPKEIGDLLRHCRQLVLLGDPGGGKTTLVKWLARTYALGPDAVKQRLGLDEDLVPVVVPIAGFADAHQKSDDPAFSLLDYIEQSYNDQIPSLGRKLRKQIDEGRAPPALRWVRRSG